MISRGVSNQTQGIRIHPGLVLAASQPSARDLASPTGAAHFSEVRTLANRRSRTECLTRVLTGLSQYCSTGLKENKISVSNPATLCISALREDGTLYLYNVSVCAPDIGAPSLPGSNTRIPKSTQPNHALNRWRSSRSQMIAWRTLAETHSLTTTVAMMISRMSDTWVQASMVIAALSGSPMPPAPTRPSTVDSRMLMSQRNTETPANAGMTCGTMP